MNQNGTKMGTQSYPGGFQKHFAKTALIFYRFSVSLGFPWAPFSLPFASFWLPLISLLAPFGSLWAPFYGFLSSFALLSAPLGLFWASSASHRSEGKSLARSCQDLAEILPRTCRESANNQPRTRRMNLKQSCLSNCKFFETTSFADERFHKIA